MMTDFVHRQAQRQVGRLLAGHLSPAAHRRLRRHLGGCERCRAYYEAQRRLEDALFAPAAVNPAALERLADLVVEPAPVPAAGRRWLPYAVAVLGASAAMLFVALRPPMVAPTVDDFQARGVTAAPAAASLSLFAIDTAARRVTRLARDHAALVVTRGSTLQLGYRNLSYRYAFVLGIRADGELQWYHPADPKTVAQRGVMLVRGAVDEPFGNAWTITAPPGPLRLVAVFSEEPLEVRSVEAAVRHAGLEGALDVAGAAVDSVRLEVVR